jgi:LacI family transcriptional regulator
MQILQNEIAKVTGVSRSTVSRCLSGSKGVNKVTRERIVKVANEMGFRPNAFAKALATGKANTLGVIIRELSYISRPYMGLVVAGFAGVSDCNDLGMMFALSVASQGNNALDQDPEYLRIIKERRVDGAIVVDMAMPESELNLLSRKKFPIVLLDRKISDSKLPCVRINYRKPIHEAISNLVSLGHRRIAVLTPGVKLFDLSEKTTAYMEALEENNIPFDPELFMVGDKFGKWSSGVFSQMVEKLVTMPNPPTAYISFWDGMVIPLCEKLRSFGLNIPKDASVIGHECFSKESPSSDFFTFDCSVIEVPAYELGKSAGELLMKIAYEGNSSTNEIILDAQFRQGKTCDKNNRAS